MKQTAIITVDPTLPYSERPKVIADQLRKSWGEDLKIEAVNEVVDGHHYQVHFEVLQKSAPKQLMVMLPAIKPPKPVLMKNVSKPPGYVGSKKTADAVSPVPEALKLMVKSSKDLFSQFQELAEVVKDDVGPGASWPDGVGLPTFLLKGEKVEDEEGILTALGMKVANLYAKRWISGQRDLELERQYPSLQGLFSDIRIDSDLAREHAID